MCSKFYKFIHLNLFLYLIYFKAAMSLEIDITPKDHQFVLDFYDVAFNKDVLTTYDKYASSYEKVLELNQYIAHIQVAKGKQRNYLWRLGGEKPTCQYELSLNSQIERLVSFDKIDLKFGQIFHLLLVSRSVVTILCRKTLWRQSIALFLTVCLRGTVGPHFSPRRNCARWFFYMSLKSHLSHIERLISVSVQFYSTKTLEIAFFLHGDIKSQIIALNITHLLINRRKKKLQIPFFLRGLSLIVHSMYHKKVRQGGKMKIFRVWKAFRLHTCIK